MKDDPQEITAHPLLPFFVIGIGASAGGLSAITTFIKQLKPNCPHAIVIVQHLAEGNKSMMSDLLAKNTDLPIHQVTEHMLLESGNIYLIPADQNIALECRDVDAHTDSDDVHFNLVPRTEKPGVNLPIDVFFHSMANAAQSRAIGVVLSGTGSDGRNGIRAIKAMDGIVIAQDPNSAEFDGMPNAAIDTKLVDFVLAPSMIAEEIDRYVHSVRSGNRGIELQLEKDDENFHRLVKVVSEHAGASFAGYKTPMLRRRIAKRMSFVGCFKPTEYEQLLNENDNEKEKLYQEFLVGVTHFFRDSEAWEIIAAQVLPLVLDAQKETIKIWSVGCSTGEEPYSLAILIDEYLEKIGKARLPVTIFATDMDEQALIVAQRGIFPPSITENISQERLGNYFSACSGGYEIKPALRKSVIFSKHNVLESPPYINVDLLICRNLLIYLDNQLQNQILAKFAFSLKRNGVLFLGPSESLGIQEKSFDTLNSAWRIFSNRKVGLTEDYKASNFLVQQQKYPQPIRLQPRKSVIQDEYANAMLKGVLLSNDVCTFVVDEFFHILDSVGPYGKFLRIPSDGFTNNLLEMIPQRAATSLTLGLRKAATQNGFTQSNIDVGSGDDKLSVNVSIGPLKEEMPEFEQRYVVVFKEASSSISLPETTPRASDNKNSDQYIAELEQDLKNTQSHLQTTIEDLQASNEELQSTNEELMASNEELQSTYEEMQSVNEELHTVNTEYQLKNTELIQLNEDMNNLLNSTEVAVLFIDEDFHIRKFTPAIQELFSLQENDIGRPIRHFMPNLVSTQEANLLDLILGDTQKEISIEAQSIDGHWFMVRVVPFRSTDDALNGRVISFTNIEELRKTQAQLRDKSEALENVLESTMAGYWDWYIQDDYEYMSPTFKSMFGYTDEEIPNKPDAWQKIIHPDDLSGVFEIFDTHVKSKGEIPYDNEVRYFHKDGHIVWVWCRGKVIEWNDKGEAVRMVGSHVDITAIKTAENALIVQNEESKQMSYITAHDLREPLNTIQNHLSFLQGQKDLQLSDENNTVLKHVIKASERLSNLINDLLQYSRLSDHSLTKESISLGKVIDQALEDLDGAISQNNVQIDKDDISNLKIPANWDMMTMLFLNLISNAIKFKASNRTPVIKISAEDTASTVFISIADNGIGIESKYVHKIFEVFKRLHSQSEYEGSGIGLALCKKIIDLHEGQITLESSLNEGSTFTVELPKRL